MLNRRKRAFTADQFFAEVEGRDEKYELVDGEIWLMPGGTNEHADIGGAIFAALFSKLRGTGCRPANSDAGLQLDLTNVRYPDVAVYCDPRDFGPEAAERRFRRYPKVIFEVLSPSTVTFDRGGKIKEYKTGPSVTAIVHVDPSTRTIEVHERTGPAAWVQREVGVGEDLVLADPPMTLTAAEIFGDA